MDSDNKIHWLRVNSKAGVKLLNIFCWFKKLTNSASLNKNKEVVGENNDVEPTMLANLTPA